MTMTEMTPVEELTQKTQAFWKLSQVWNGIKRDVEITTGEAIELCTIMQARTSIQRPLSYAIEALLEEIIMGEGNKALESKLLPFQKPVKKQRRGAKQ